MYTVSSSFPRRRPKQDRGRGIAPPRLRIKFNVTKGGWKEAPLYLLQETAEGLHRCRRRTELGTLCEKVERGGPGPLTLPLPLHSPRKHPSLKSNDEGEKVRTC